MRIGCEVDRYLWKCRRPAECEADENQISLIGSDRSRGDRLIGGGVVQQLEVVDSVGKSKWKADQRAGTIHLHAA
jgi:hypothetical protein